FRQDLYYRLNILLLPLPPLRERHGDLPLLARHLAEKVAGRLNNRRLADDALIQAIVEAAQGYAWPGNIRELENVIERTMVFRGLDQTGQGIDRETLKEIAPELFAGRDAPAEQSLGDSRD